MPKITVIRGYIDHEARRRDNARLRRNLAEGLITHLCIPEGRHLVALIGSGHERTNREALLHWLERHWHEVEEARASGASPFQRLENLLTSTLLD